MPSDAKKIAAAHYFVHNMIIAASIRGKIEPFNRIRTNLFDIIGVIVIGLGWLT